CQQYNTLPYTF
nr:immunoglobulin light chain junction region [Macaca mulatta]MOV81919.1 immunoglobulin light chain junction region [Macaca mulatta]MOV83560.1 immunoglobulin light chain junction region [Macaca mulatta]MOV84411.1 immunoglobulin light chain junction region [Macaca mulatta]MOV85240.1 immunoglobulin light chain junction region [Macaca mulatta]